MQVLDYQALAFVGYPEPGSNRHGLLHWCLRPARLPIPPSGLVASGRLGLVVMLKVIDLLVRVAKIL